MSHMSAKKMTPSERQQHWEEVYRSKPAVETSWYQAEPTTSLDMIHNTGALADTRNTQPVTASPLVPRPCSRPDARSAVATAAIRSDSFTRSSDRPRMRVSPCAKAAATACGR